MRQGTQIAVKYRPLSSKKQIGGAGATQYTWFDYRQADLGEAATQRMNLRPSRTPRAEYSLATSLRYVMGKAIACRLPVSTYRERSYLPAERHWKTSISRNAPTAQRGIGCQANRQDSLMYKRFLATLRCPDSRIFGPIQSWRIRFRKGIRGSNHFGDRTLHPHDHRPRRPRPRPDLRLGHHRLRRRAMGATLDHDRHLACCAGAGSGSGHGRPLSLLPALRQR